MADKSIRYMPARLKRRFQAGGLSGNAPLPRSAMRDAPSDLELNTKTTPAQAVSDVVSIGTITDIASYVKYNRKAQKLKQSELASRAGVGNRFISELENGKATLQIGKVITVLRALQIEITLK